MNNKKKIPIDDLSKLALNTLEKNNKKTIKIKADNAEFKQEVNIENDLNNIIGKNIDKINDNNFNFSAAIFSFSYFIYRKMYITALLLISLILGLKILIVDNLIFVSLYVVICVICGVFFNKYYITIIKNKILKLKTKTEDKYNRKVEKLSKRNLILAIIIYILVIGFIIILILDIKTIAILGAVVSFINSINISEYKFYKMNSINFVNIVEKYNETAIFELESPGEYTYRIKDKKYNFVVIPYNDDKEDVICTYEKKKWNDSSSLSQNSSTCKEYFKDIFTNYTKDYDISLITSAKMVISSKGKISDKSYLKYNDITCKYNIKKHEFKCSK